MDRRRACGFSISEVRDLIRAADAAGIDSIVRVPSHDLTFIGRVLDAGAIGIIVPQVKSVAEGRAVTAAARFGPAGTRGACPCGRAFGHATQDWVSDYRRADVDVFVFGIIEDPECVGNVEAIARECNFDVTATSTLLVGDLARRPGCGASVRPFSRLAANRTRHLRTVSRETSSLAATEVSGAVPPSSAQASTILARSASDCDVVRLRTSASSDSRSPSVSSSGQTSGSA